MSHRKQLEQVLDMLINEEQQQAEELLHQIMVEKARAAYEDLMNNEQGLSDEGDFKADFAADIEAADEIEQHHDEIDSDEEGITDLDDEEHMDVEDLQSEVKDLASEVSDLQAMFDELVLGLEAGAEDPADMDMDLDLEDEEVMEATKLQHEVGAVSNAEGELAGTGKNSKKGATGKEAPYTRAPSRTETKGKVVDFAGGDEKGSSAPDAKDHTPASNVEVKHAAAAQKPKEKEAGDAGTHSPVASRK